MPVPRVVACMQYPLNKTFLEDLENETTAAAAAAAAHDVDQDQQPQPVQGGGGGRVGVAFKKIAPFFKMFSAYLSSYDQVPPTTYYLLPTRQPAALPG